MIFLMIQVVLGSFEVIFEVFEVNFLGDSGGVLLSFFEDRASVAGSTIPQRDGGGMAVI